MAPLSTDGGAAFFTVLQLWGLLTDRGARFGQRATILSGFHCVQVKQPDKPAFYFALRCKWVGADQVASTAGLKMRCNRICPVYLRGTHPEDRVPEYKRSTGRFACPLCS